MGLPAWDLPEEIKRRFGQSPGKQRAMVKDGHLLLILHQLPDPDRERKAIFFWRQPEGKWLCSEWGEGLSKLRKHVREYDEAADKLRDEYEKADEAEDYFRILERIAPLRHSAGNLHATLQSAREAIHDDRDIIDLRDWAYEVERSLVLLYEDTKNALDFSIARKSEEQARLSTQSVQTAHRLNILAAIFFPLTALSSVFGMNMRSGFEDAAPWVFWVIFVVGVMLGFAIRSWVLQGTGDRKK